MVTNRSYRYLDQFLNLRCNVDLQLAEVFPNNKEITESIAMMNAVFKLGINRQREDIVVIAVGDGCTPRTGALIAHTTKWNVCSVDPQLKIDVKYDGIKRLTLFSQKIEDAVGLSLQVSQSNVIVLACHSHAGLKNTIDSISRFIPQTISMISMACCKKDNLPIRPDFRYIDKHVWSPKNEINVWKPRNFNFWLHLEPKLLGEKK